MKKEKRLLVVASCDVCKKLKSLLDGDHIAYTTLDVNNHSKLADEVEALLGVYKYPMAIIETGSSTAYVYLTTEQRLLGHRTLSNGADAYGFFTVEDMCSFIKIN